MIITVKNFRNVFSNVAIGFILIFLFSITYIGGVVGAFGSSSETDAYYHGNVKNNNISIMINVYQGTEYIDGMLKVLETYGAKATFFVGGSWVSKNSEVLLKIFEQGHEIGNHGYWHKDHKKLSEENNYKEMKLTHEIVKSITNKDITVFAPPSGSFGNTTLKVSAAMGYKTIMWTKDTIDWRDQNTKTIYSRAVAKPKNGDLILMHPTKCTLEALPDVVAFYVNNGYKLTTVSENIV